MCLTQKLKKGITGNKKKKKEKKKKKKKTYASWEGTTNDTRVFLDALTRLEIQFPWPTKRKYYLVDLGYPCTFGFLPPYCGK